MVETIERIELPEAIQERYLRYAMSVITSRALPDVRDGLKPVQRRILYAMENDLYLRSDSKPVKCSKVVGQVLGNYHPHSDTAIYDAMVRMAQDWALRYPLVDGHGNFGAITGDRAAAIRYTEARLQALACELMLTLKEDTVPRRPTYDAEKLEPEVLPAPAPLLLLNGSTGIAVGMATNIPPHNLTEIVKATVALIDKPDTSVAQLLRMVKGPDFPTAGEVLSSREDLRKIYETGRGSIKLRGTFRVETEEGKGQRVTSRSLIVDSIPYGTTTSQVLSKFRELVESKKIPQILHVSDQTNADDGVRLVVEIKVDADPDMIMAALYRLTTLESSYGVNLTCLLPTPSGVGTPATCDLKLILQAWLDFRFEVVTRSIEFRLRRLRERIHILGGLAKVLRSIKDAVELIRTSKDRHQARERLEKKYKLDEIQANAVLEIQLYRLAQLEIKKVKDELAEKSKEAARLAKLLKGPKPRWSLIKKDLLAFGKRYGDKRRTRINLKDEDALEYDPTALIQEEDTHVVLSAVGRLKRVRTLDLNKVRLREGDELLAVLQGSTLAYCVFFTNFGSGYVMRINDVPATSGFGEPIQKYFAFKDGERVVSAFSLDPRVTPFDRGATVFAATAQGHVLRALLEPHFEPSTRSGRKFARLGGPDDEVVSVELVPSRGVGKRDVLLVTSKGWAIHFGMKEVPALAGVGKGKRGIKLAKKEQVVGATGLGKLCLETTRGSQETLKTKKIAKTELNGEAEQVKKRGGWKRVLTPPPVLLELPEQSSKNGKG